MEKNENNKDIYAVVLFIDTNDISCIPLSWIVKKNDELWCFWPKKCKQKFIRELKKPEINENWDIYQIIIKEKFTNYEEARRKEIHFSLTSGSENEDLPKKRKRKRKVHYDRSVTPPPNFGEADDTESNDSSDLESPDENVDNMKNSNKFKLPVDRNKSKYFKISKENVSTKNTNLLIKKFMDSQDTTKTLCCENDQDAENYLGVIDNNSNNKEVVQADDEVVIEDITAGSISDGAEKENNMMFHSIQDSNKDISSNREILKKLVSIETKINLLTAQQDAFQSEIRRKLNIKVCSSKQGTIIPLPKFPINTTEILSAFDKDLTKDEFKNELGMYLLNIGGVDARSSITRILQRIFTDELGEQCSWTGQKSNFKLKDLNLMVIIKECVREGFPVTDKFFEVTVMNWFRYSKLRRERRTKV